MSTKTLAELFLEKKKTMANKLSKKKEDIDTIGTFKTRE